LAIYIPSAEKITWATNII